MPLNLKIENETSLPDGGPLGISVTGRRNIDIGRDSHLDWTLPDPTRFISSKHAEIRYKDGGYWLHDVSTNGTFLNGGDHRMQAPHRLRNGDRFTIGHYIIAVAVEGELGDAPSAAGSGPAQAPIPSYQELRANQSDIAPPAAPAQAPAPAGAAPGNEAAQQFLRRLAEAAGVPEQLFAQQDPNQLADQIGIVMRLVAGNVMQLLNARVQAKRLARSSHHTMVQAFDNNPLKFSPTPEEALSVMFGPPTRSYLDARRAIEQSFDDLKSHQIKTYSAMQHALTLLLADLDPQTIDRDTDAEGGIAALVTSRKAKLWDAYVARWQAQV